MDLIAPERVGDPLGDALHHLRMSGAFYCHSELSEPWGMTLPELPGYLWFHAVAAGGTVLDVDGTRTTLRHGDLALVNHGTGHALRGSEDAPVPDILDLEREAAGDHYERLVHGGGGARTRLLCGAVAFDHPAAKNLVACLPPVIVIAAEHAHPMQATLTLIADETRAQKAGGEAVVTRLADVLVIQAIRAWIETDPLARSGWLGALRDPDVGRALALIHREPARPWTVADLAGELAMSRSAFAARFTEQVGVPAMQYLAQWRMQVALGALREDGATVGQVAGALGYRSEAAFARAFKRVTGTSPGAARRADAAPAFSGTAGPPGNAPST